MDEAVRTLIPKLREIGVGVVKYPLVSVVGDGYCCALLFDSGAPTDEELVILEDIVTRCFRRMKYVVIPSHRLVLMPNPFMFQKLSCGQWRMTRRIFQTDLVRYFGPATLSELRDIVSA